MFAPASLDAAAIIEAMRVDGACARPMLAESFREALLGEARGARYRRGRAAVGTGDAVVHQDLSYCEEFSGSSLFHVLARRFHSLFEQAARTLDPYPFETTLVINDLMLQHYTAGALGISPHRDGARYVNLACIFVLEGGGGFFVCEDRQGRGAREILAPPGSAIFLRCPGLRGATGRVFHAVADIGAPRTTFGLRHDKGLECGEQALT